MPTSTVNLGLSTYNNSTDSQSKFLTFRTDLDGVTNSNMTKIDTWAGTVNKEIDELKNQKPTILLNASWISLGYYEATSTEITDYVLDMLLTLRLDKDNDGTTTIKINSLSVKSLMKYGADGTLVNLEVGDLRIHHEYSFRYDGTSFVWQGGTSADQMNIIGNSGEIVTVASDKTLESSGVALTNLVTKSQIKNNLTETTTGNILDATQGKILDDKIGVLTNLTTTAKTDLVSATNENVTNIGLKLAKTDVVNTTTQVEADGKALNAVQANPSVSGTLAQQINVLQVSPNFTGTPTIQGNTIATTTLVEKAYTNSELLNGWTIVAGGTGVYLQKVGREVKFQAMITTTVQPSQVQILVIPTEYRPSKTVYMPLFNQVGGTLVGGIYILSSGSCYFSGGVPSVYTGNLTFNGSWFTS